MLDGFQADILHPALQGLYADAIQRGAQAKQSADQLWQQMQEQMQAPTPQMDPQRQFISTLMGGLSQALAPQLGGQQQAQTGIAEVNADLRNKRAMSLQALHTRYGEAAQQAEQAGDNERAIKMRNAELKVNKELADIARTQHLEDTKASNEQRMKELSAQGQNALAVARESTSRALDVARLQDSTARIKAGFMPDGSPIPPQGMPVADYQKIVLSYLSGSATDAGGRKLEKGEVYDGLRAFIPQRLRTETLDPAGAGLSLYLKRQRQLPAVKGAKGFDDWFGRSGTPLFTDSERIQNAIDNFYGATLDANDMDQLLRVAVRAGYNQKDVATYLITYAANAPDWPTSPTGAPLIPASVAKAAK